MSEQFKNAENNEGAISEVMQLSKRLAALSIDSSETELVVQEAALMFGDGRPEHEVEQIIADYLEMKGHTISEAEAEADRLADEMA